MSKELLERLGVYLDSPPGCPKYCYKHSFPGVDVTIVADTDQKQAASRFFIEYLKSLHYSLRWLYENSRFDELKATIEKYKAFKDPNINQTISIVTRSMIIP